MFSAEGSNGWHSLVKGLMNVCNLSRWPGSGIEGTMCISRERMGVSTENIVVSLEGTPMPCRGWGCEEGFIVKVEFIKNNISRWGERLRVTGQGNSMRKGKTLRTSPQYKGN